MTPQEKQSLKIVAAFGGVIILIVVTILIVRKIQQANAEKREREESEEDKSTAPRSGGGSSPMNTLEGRTFSKTEIEKMQSFMFNMAALDYNDEILTAIRTTGGIDGKIGSGFKSALQKSIAAGYVKSLDDLYTQAMKH